MVQFTATICQAAEMGEKTGWTYIIIPPDVAEELNPGQKKSFRVKGKLDDHSIKEVSLLPVGGGRFMMPLNATLRKGIRKKKGAMLNVRIQVDKTPQKICAELLECLADEPKAQANFNKLPPSHQRYFSKWIEEAKTEPTKTKRIALTVSAMSTGARNYGEVLRSLRDGKE